MQDPPVHPRRPFEVEPRPRHLELVCKHLEQLLPHAPQSIRHGLDFIQPETNGSACEAQCTARVAHAPCGVEFGVRQDRMDNMSTPRRWMEVETARDSSQLRVNADFRFRRLQWDGDNRGGVRIDAHHLAHQSNILVYKAITHRVKALSKHERKSLVHHEPQRLGVAIHVTTREPLKRHDAERYQLSFLLVVSANPNDSASATYLQDRREQSPLRGIEFRSGRHGA